MGKLTAVGFIAGAAVLLLIGAGQLAGSTHLFESDADALLRQDAARLALEQKRIDVEAHRLDVARSETQADALAPVQVNVYAILLALIPVALAGAALIAVDAYGQRRRPVLYPDMAGALPYARRDIIEGVAMQDQRHALAGLHTARVEAARHPALPAHYSPVYSPHVSYHHQTEGYGLPELEPGDGDAGAVPTYTELRARGIIGRGRPLVLGWLDGAPLLGSWEDLYSTAVAGISGSGKTTLERFIIGQAAEHGARLAILDPHAGKGEQSLSVTLAPLHDAFLCEPALLDRDMLLLLQLVDTQLQARLTGRDRDRTPLICVVDEFTQLCGRSTLAGPLAALLENIATGGRGVNVFAMISGQIWSSDRAGGTPLRDSLASAYVMRIKPHQARMLVNSDRIEDTLELATGQAYLWRTSGEIDKIWIPNTTEDMIATSRPQVARAPLAGALLTPGDPAGDGAGRLRGDYGAAQSTLTAEDTQILQLFGAGVEIPGIIQRLWDIGSKNPKEYTPKYRQVQATLRQHYRGPG